jgi:hypothetical protein
MATMLLPRAANRVGFVSTGVNKGISNRRRKRRRLIRRTGVAVVVNVQLVDRKTLLLVVL